MKDYENTKLISEECMVKVNFEGLKGGVGKGKWLQKRLDSIQITHENFGKVLLSREESVNLKLFLEKALEQEF